MNFHRDAFALQLLAVNREGVGWVGAHGIVLLQHLPHLPGSKVDDHDAAFLGISEVSKLPAYIHPHIIDVARIARHRVKLVFLFPCAGLLIDAYQLVGLALYGAHIRRSRVQHPKAAATVKID